MTEKTTWRQILKRHSAPFLSWLNEKEVEYTSLDRLAKHLTQFLIKKIRSPSAARNLWNAIPKVRAACNDPATYELPFAAQAYAYVHLLQRYSRTWAVLRHLTSTFALPMGAQGVHALDIGTGPAPALYAIDDYYASVRKFAEANGIPELTIPAPTLDCVENSQAMSNFIHYFSEFYHRRGPFGPTISDFSGLDFQAEREFHFRNSRYETYWDEFTQQYEEWYEPQIASESASRLFRYRLIVFSNFLTLGDSVETFEEEIRKLFNDLRSGSVVIVLGGTGGHYSYVYERLAELAKDARMNLDSWDTNELGKSIEGRYAARIKSAQNDVYRHLENMAGAAALPRRKEWPDYWTPEPSPRARNRFALRVYRCGRWPDRGERTG